MTKDEIFIANRRRRMLADDPLMALDGVILHSMHRHLYYAWIYNHDDLLQTRIDEEGCGAFFAAFRS